MHNTIPVEIKILRTINGKSPLPVYATDGSAAFDFYAATKRLEVIDPGRTFFVPTGISIWIRDPSKALLILPRSGLGCKNRIVPGNSPGLLDADYQNEVIVCLTNMSDDVFRFEPGDRIAQGIVIPVFHMEFNVVDEFSSETSRTGGFGSTGIK